MSKKINIQAKLTITDQDSIDKYLQELRLDKATTPLTRDDEVSLFNQYKLSGDLKIKDRLIKANLRWVISVAKQYSFPKVKFADLINEGNIGMIESIDKFDVSRGVSFITFATDYIRSSINTYINDVAQDIPQPGNRYRINKLVKKSITDLKLIAFENPTDEQIVEHYMSIKNTVDPKLNTVLLNEIRNNSKDFISMYTTVSGTDENLELHETFKSNNEWSADYNLNQNEKNTSIINSLNEILDEREVSIVCLTFGLNDVESLTPEQIGDRLGYTRERIGQILNKAIGKLKQHKNVFGPLLGVSKDTTTKFELNN